MQITGTVTEIFYQDSQKYYFFLQSPQVLYKVHLTGLLPVFINQRITVEGELISDIFYTKKVFYNELNLTIIQNFFLQYKFPSLGKKTLDKLFESYGISFFSLFFYDIDQLQHPSITSKKKDLWKKKIAEFSINKIEFLFIQKGFTKNFSNKIEQKFKHQENQIEKNPYIIETIKGISFKKADQVAQSLGISNQDKRRIEAAIFFALKKSLEEGHTYESFLQIKNRLKDFKINIQENDIYELVDKKKIIKTTIKNNHFFSTPSSFFAEKFISQFFLKNYSKRMPLSFTSEDFLKKSFLSIEQQNSISKIFQSPRSILTGGPGCGKTTTLKTFIHILEIEKKNFLLASPTGRAAKRLNEVSGKEVKTLHRLLQWSSKIKNFLKNETNQLETDFLIIDEASMIDIFLMKSLCKALNPNTQILLVGDYHQLPSVGPGEILRDLVLSKKIELCELTQIFRQEEKSSIKEIAHSILQGKMSSFENPLKDKSLWQKQDCLFINSVEPTQEEKDFFIKYNTASTLILDKEYYDKRTLQKTTTQENSVDISKYTKKLVPHKNVYDLVYKNYEETTLFYNLTAQDTIKRLYKETIPKMFPNKKIQILTPMIKGSCGTQALNTILQKECNHSQKQHTSGKKIFKEGDPIIQLKNNYDLDLFNGDLGKIMTIESHGFFLKMDDGRELFYPHTFLNDLDLSYALTVHKSQGSEFDVVIIPVLTQHYMLLFRNLIYTALTRGKKMVIFVGTKKAYQLALYNINKKMRQTLLSYFLSFK